MSGMFPCPTPYPQEERKETLRRSGKTGEIWTSVALSVCICFAVSLASSLQLQQIEADSLLKVYSASLPGEAFMNQK